MATSGTRTFNPDLAEITVEAFERCQIRPSAITGEHISSAIRSCNFMLSDWSTKGFKQFELANATLSMIVSVANYTLPAGTLDIWSAVLRRNGIDDPMYAISRTDYNDIPKKDVEGRPDRYFVDRGQTGDGQRVAYIWPTPDNSTDVIRYIALRRIEDVTNLAETAPVAYEWNEAFVSGLAAKLAVKFAPQLVSDRVAEAMFAFKNARDADRDRSPLRIRVRGYGSR